MMIWIQLREKDPLSNDNFKTGTFEVPVVDIITKAEQGPEDDRPRYEKKFKVIDEGLTEYYVDVAFCFEPEMRRIEQ